MRTGPREGLKNRKLNNMHKYGVLIGRFEPFHNGHFSLVKFALDKVEELLIILGSCNVARSIKNPWTADERKEMILSCFGKEEQDRIIFLEASDYLYNDNRWLTCIQQQVDEVTDGEEDIVLIGEQKDRSSFYLKMFPQWKHLEAGMNFIDGLDATRIREDYFVCKYNSYAFQCLEENLPGPVFNILSASVGTDDYETLRNEFCFVCDYKNKWETAPYAPTFVTVDTVVIQSGHVLLVKRKSCPGKGLWALPGGFLNQHERIEDAALRELREETVIALPKEELRKMIVDRHVFDHPDRSTRVRTITHAFCLNLGSGKLPRVKGSDDAEKAFWLPLKEVSSKENMFLEDHAHIIRYFCDRF
jgi:bifunctional NMN adenylyltransferase/nudix hydrolase